ncbi:MAG TPA: DHH family phosphoesterase [Phycisphaerae bacterium]|nr:DHH family phosphoesterase [Phycisphaerae bacterium]
MAETQARPAAVPPELTVAITGMKRPLVIGHVVPDTDCLGSMLAVARNRPGGDGRVCLPAGSVSQRLQFLVDWAAVDVVGSEGLADADGFIVVDAATKERCNVGPGAPSAWSAGRTVVNIDHHQTNSRFGDVNWVAPEASSTAELVYRVLEAAGRPVDAVTASLLYAGIHADTRGFTLFPDKGAALAVAAELVDAGARVAEIGERLYRNKRISEFRLLRVIYANTHLAADGRIAYSTADHDEIAGCDCGPADIDEQVDVPRSLNGIGMAILFTEGIRGKIRINLRGEAGISVLALAEELGGGGHDQAAGVVLEGSIRQAVDRVLPLAEEHLRRQEPA